MTPPLLKEKNAYHGAKHLAGAKVGEFTHKCRPPLCGGYALTRECYAPLDCRSAAVRNSVHFPDNIKRVLLPIHKYEECK